MKISRLLRLDRNDYFSTSKGEKIAKFLEDKIDLENSLVLDIGCNVGAISIPFAKKCKLICSGDLSKKPLRILSKKTKKEKLKNIFISNFNAPELPFKDNLFNLVIINGVLEWTPCGVSGSPRNIQLKVLKEVRRVLKKDGILYLGIENRYFIGYFLGKRDNHTNLRFVPFLPRVVANLYSKIVSGKEYRNYLYGKQGYKKLLKEAGFDEINFYTPIPTYSFPETIVEINDINGIKKGAEYFKNRILRLGIKTLASLHLYGIFGHSFVMLCK